jgi:hypothetical protein
MNLRAKISELYGPDSREYGAFKRAIIAERKYRSSAVDREDVQAALYYKTVEALQSAKAATFTEDDEFYAWLYVSLKNAALKIIEPAQDKAKATLSFDASVENIEEVLERAAARSGLSSEDWDTAPLQVPRVYCAQFTLAKFVTFLPHRKQDPLHPLLVLLRRWRNMMGYSNLTAAEWAGQIKETAEVFSKPEALVVHALRGIGLKHAEIAEVCGMPRTPASAKRGRKRFTTKRFTTG